MIYVMVDIEADGPCPGIYSMVSLGAVAITSPMDQFDKVFYGEFAPMTTSWDDKALAVSGFTRADTLLFPSPKDTMQKFLGWLLGLRSREDERLVFISDNNGFDWQFVNFYFWYFLNSNPFGHSSMNLGSLYKGMMADTRMSFKRLRKTKHTHNPVDDAMGNAEAFMHMINHLGLAVWFK